MCRFQFIVLALALLAGTAACSVHERNLQYDNLSCGTGSSCPGSQTCYGGTCCESAPSGSACSLPDCGCAEGEVCDADVKTKTMQCRTTNGVEEGQACSDSAVCGVGLGCYGGVCKRYCKTDSDCPAVGGVQACLQTSWSDGNDIQGVKICARVCDPVNAQSPVSPLLPCPIGRSCGSSSTGASDCGWAGASKTGEYCEKSSDCAAGNYCTQWNTCNRYCYTDTDCPTGSACGSFSKGQYAGGRTVGGCSVSLVDALNQELTQQCKKYNECAPGWFAGSYGTVATCVARSRIYSQWFVALPSTKLTTSLISECTSAWVNLTCADYFTADPDECWVAGALTDGSPCNVADQCQSLYCHRHGWSCGTCAPMPTVGASCESRNDCGRGQWCMPDNTCQLPHNENESCSDTRLCRSDLSCYNGTCVKRPATAGATCDKANGLECADDQNYYCSSQTNRCLDVEWSDVGGSCSMTTSTITACAAMNKCSGVTCVDGPTNGGDCDPSNDYCQWPAYCSAQSKCTLPTTSSVCSATAAAH